jgi:hypothetical protein
LQEVPIRRGYGFPVTRRGTPSPLNAALHSLGHLSRRNEGAFKFKKEPRKHYKKLTNRSSALASIGDDPK